MRLSMTLFGLLALSTAAVAAEPNNINVECKFRNGRGKQALRCHSVTNIHLQGRADDHLLVNCPGLGTDTIVYNGDAEYTTGTVITVNPAGTATLPSVVLPGNAFDCRQTPARFESVLNLPARAPYNGATLGGECKVVTAGCGSETLF